MKTKIKKIQMDQTLVNTYFSQTNVIRNSTSRNTNLRFGRLVVVSDQDPDG